MKENQEMKYVHSRRSRGRSAVASEGGFRPVGIQTCAHTEKWGAAATNHARGKNDLGACDTFTNIIYYVYLHTDKTCKFYPLAD